MTETLKAPPIAGAKTLRMLDLNDVRMSGRLTAEPRPLSTKDGRSVVHFSLAMNRRYKDAEGLWHEETSFVPATVWNALAEECKKRLHKGSPLYVEGRLRSERWKDRDGQTKYALKIDVSKVRFLANRKDTLPSDGTAAPAE
jgi:single-strand DNA-binding protein